MYKSCVYNSLQYITSHCNISRLTALLYNTALQNIKTMSYDLLHCITCHCNTSQRAALHHTDIYKSYVYNSLQYSMTHCDTSQRTALFHTALQCIQTHCYRCTPSYNTSQSITTHCNTLQNITAHWNTPQNITAHCNTPQHTAILAHLHATQALQNIKNATCNMWKSWKWFLTCPLHNKKKQALSIARTMALFLTSIILLVLKLCQPRHSCMCIYVCVWVWGRECAKRPTYIYGKRPSCMYIDLFSHKHSSFFPLIHMYVSRWTQCRYILKSNLHIYVKRDFHVCK